MTKKRSTKRALLMSTLSLLMCVSMLIGSTYAWFTDSVVSGNNKIVAGNLDVVLEYKTKWEDQWTVVDENTKIFQEGALYEPGYTEVVFLRVSNAGSLALKYQLMVNIASEQPSTNVYGEEFKLSDYLQIGSYVQDEFASGFNYADILMPTMFGNRETAVANVANLAKLSTADSIVQSSAPVLAGEQTSQVVALVVTMPTTVGNEANYKTGAAAPEINLGISLLATQLVAEDDDFGSDYDEDAEYPEHPAIITSADELKAALTNGGNYELGADIEVGVNETIVVGSGMEARLNLNGHKISSTADKSGNQELFLVKGNLTVINGSLEYVAKNNQGWNAMATIFDVTAGGVLNMEEVTAAVSGTDMNFIVHMNNWGSATANVVNCDLTASYVAVRAFNSGYDMNNVTIKDTDVTGGGRLFWVHNYTAEGKDDSTLNLDIYSNNNTCENQKPVRFGFDGEVYFDLNGNAIS